MPHSLFVATFAHQYNCHHASRLHSLTDSLTKCTERRRVPLGKGEGRNGGQKTERGERGGRDGKKRRLAGRSIFAEHELLNGGAYSIHRADNSSQTTSIFCVNPSFLSKFSHLFAHHTDSSASSCCFFLFSR